MSKQIKMKRKAFLAGADAHEDNLSRGNNPHKAHGNKWRSWCLGWDAYSKIKDKVDDYMNCLSEHSIEYVQDVVSRYEMNMVVFVETKNDE